MEISNAKSFSAVQNTESALKKPTLADDSTKAQSTADKVTLSAEALALASDDGGASVQTVLPGWPPVMPPPDEDQTPDKG